MTTTYTGILQRAVKYLIRDSAFRKRWIKASSLSHAVKVRYELHDFSINTRTIPRAVGMLDPNVDDLTTRHQSGAYKGVKNKVTYFYFQESNIQPPSFPRTIYNKKVWDCINDVDKKMLDEYVTRINLSKSRHRVN
jgi:hypothetical protein